mgnify:CR=1 FL=1
MTTITINVTGEAARERISKLAQAVGPAILLKLIGQRLLSYIDESFRTRGRGQWRPLAASTLETRPHGGDAPLQDSGRYKQSFVTETDGRSYVEAGTNLKTASGIPLGPIHEHGTGPFTIRAVRARVLAARLRTGGWMLFGREVHHPGIPARPVLPNQVTAERLVGETVEGMLREVANGGDAGGRVG